ncbi:MAG TPA: hypothetical protein ENI31_04595 [Candidatus Omnitrophica bacterium]|nr:MAG: hypothetical protein DRP61_00950 [Candidatus Omnitrophota bacterium]RKY34451.1 MAG: hypothetical protein DRP69_04595 [Candidatus Omnitrophota bacterium]RKY44400.1 MAG: hypothetical protein DRP80_02295 [Candidatus Omnitrophota bacterium]HEC69542.1 hypothetical protein [Candidatus Omnitrophota bacterium]
MNCKKIKKLIQLYIDQEIDSEKTQVLKEHLKTCASCQREVNTLVSLKKLISSQEKITTSQDFIAKVIEKIRKQEILKMNLEGAAKRLIPLPLALGLVTFIYLGSLQIRKENFLEEYLLSALDEREVSLFIDREIYEELF